MSQILKIKNLKTKLQKVVIKFLKTDILGLNFSNILGGIASKPLIVSQYDLIHNFEILCFGKQTFYSSFDQS